MLARRMLTFLVLLLVVTALSAGLVAPPRQPAPTTGLPVTPPTRSPIVARTIDASRSRPRTVAIHRGDLLSLTVRADDSDAVELQGLAGLRPIAPDTPVTFSVLADAPGEYPVVLVGAGRTVGTVRVLSSRD
jgi:hypothetical protein